MSTHVTCIYHGIADSSDNSVISYYPTNPCSKLTIPTNSNWCITYFWYPAHDQVINPIGHCYYSVNLINLLLLVISMSCIFSPEEWNLTVFLIVSCRLCYRNMFPVDKLNLLLSQVIASGVVCNSMFSIYNWAGSRKKALLMSWILVIPKKEGRSYPCDRICIFINVITISRDILNNQKYHRLPFSLKLRCHCQ